MAELECKWVSSRGLLKSCDRHNRIPESSSRHIDSDLLENLQDYDIVHICSWLTITIFVKRYVPFLTKKVIMVTNDSDMDAPIFEKPVGPNDTIAKEDIRNFLDSDLCVHWFTQNCTLDHPKVSPIPIGLDYHTHSPWYPCVEQEKSLNTIRQRSSPFYERVPICYGNFHFAMNDKYYSQERYDCYAQTASNCVYYEPERVDVNMTWENQSEYAFVLCPAGGGIDCHRTWEALILGCIPIIRRMNVPQEKLYDELPVLLVDKWSDISKELLEKTVAEFKTKTFNLDKLTLKYWFDIINSAKPLK